MPPRRKDKTTTSRCLPWQAPKDGSAANSIQPTDYCEPTKESNPVASHSNGRGRPASPIQKAETQLSSIPTCEILGLSIENPTHAKRATRIERKKREKLLQFSKSPKTSRARIELPPPAGRPTAFCKTRRPGSEGTERGMRETLRDGTHADTE